jgi:hypothetical protein
MRILFLGRLLTEESDMTKPKLNPAILFFYAYALTLCAGLICRDVPVQLGITQATALGMIAWLLINRRWLADD